MPLKEGMHYSIKRNEFFLLATFLLMVGYIFLSAEGYSLPLLNAHYSTGAVNIFLVNYTFLGNIILAFAAGIFIFFCRQQKRLGTEWIFSAGVFFIVTCIINYFFEPVPTASHYFFDEANTVNRISTNAGVFFCMAAAIAAHYKGIIVKIVMLIASLVQMAACYCTGTDSLPAIAAATGLAMFTLLCVNAFIYRKKIYRPVVERPSYRKTGRDLLYYH